MEVIKEKCSEIKTLVKQFKEMEDEMKLKYDLSTSLKHALYTVSMTASDSQLQLVKALTESFASDEEKLMEMTRDVEETKKRLARDKEEIRACILDLFDTYTAISDIFGEPMPKMSSLWCTRS